MWFRKYQLRSRFSTFVQIHMPDGHNTLHGTTNTNNSQVFYIMKSKNLTWILVLVSMPPSTWQAYTEKPVQKKKKTNFLLLIVVRRQAVTTTNFPQILNTSLHLPTGLILLSKNPLLKLGFYFTLKDI